MTHSTPGLRVEVLTSVGELHAITDEWSDLVDHDERASPFQDHQWLLSWMMSAMPSSEEVAVLTVRDVQRRLVAIMPLCGDATTLRWLGDGSSDHLDAIVRNGWEDDAHRTIARSLSAMGVALHLRDVPEGGHMIDVAARLPSDQVRATRGSASLFVRGTDLDTILAGLDRRRRESARRTLRRMAADGLRWTTVAAERSAVDAATHRWVRLHRAYWAGRGLIPAHATAAFEQLIAQAVKGWTTPERQSGIHELLTPDGSVLVSDLLLVSEERVVVSYLFGATPEARSRYEINTVLMKNWLEVAGRTGADGVWLGRGDEPYKLKWRPAAAATIHLRVNGRQG